MNFTYSYKDADGNLLKQRTVRDGKQQWRRPDGKGGWINNLNGAPHVLYGLPAVKAAKTVWVAPDEQAVNVIMGLGKIAVCGEYGAEKWLPEYSEQLRDKDVAVVSGTNPAWKAFAMEAANALHDVATNVRLLDLGEVWEAMPENAGLPEFKEEMKGTTDALLDYLYHNTPEWVPVAATANHTAEGNGSSPEAIRADVLQEKDIPPIVWLLDGLFADGFSMVVGASKIGKSWYVLQMVLAIARGETFLGRRTTPCKVLYLALEDSQRRLQSRMNKLLGGKKAPENLLFLTKALPLGNGFLEQLEPYVAQGVKLFVVDTLQKIRGASYNKNAYAADYEDIGALKAFADKHGIALLAVHHSRKMKDDDVFNMISGTNGIMGAADTIIFLNKEKRNDTEIKMHVTGRDVNTETLLIELKKEPFGWTCIGTADDVERMKEDEAHQSNPIVLTIKALLSESCSGWQGTATEFQNEMMRRGYGYKDTKVIGREFRALKQELYERDNIIYKEPSGNHTNRKHGFKYVELKI